MTALKNMEKTEVFAVVRVDLFHTGLIDPQNARNILSRMAIQKIVRDRQLAEREVLRLNALQEDRGVNCHYEVIPTRMLTELDK